jgi:hypothetical protein
MRGVDYAAEPEYMVDQPSALVPGRHDGLWLLSAMAAVRDAPGDAPMQAGSSGSSLIETVWKNLARSAKVSNPFVFAPLASY